MKKSSCLLMLGIGALCLFFSTSAAYGQATSWAQLIGTVTDQTRGIVPGVEVTVLNQATNVPKSTLTDDRGNYLVDKLQPGDYDLSTSLPGFKTQRVNNIRLSAEQVGRIDFVLTPGEITEEVTVTGQSTIIDTASTELASVVEEKKILDLPLRGRTLTKLAYLTTGGVSENQTGDLSETNYGGDLPAFNGQHSTSNQVLLDGTNNMGYTSMRVSVNPTPETVQEFKIITNNYSAEYGRVAGAVVHMVTKSGGNEFHGHGWWYTRNERFDANSFFSNRLGLGKLPISQHIFGASIGGPIFKDNTFFFGHFERHMDDSTTPGLMTVPTDAQRGGDFSNLDGPFDAARTAPLQLYDPFNVVDGQRAPFDGNIIPQSRWNPTSMKLLELMPPPSPNRDDYPNYAFPSERTQRRLRYSGRIDHQFGNDDRVFGRFSFQNSPQIVPRPGAIAVPGVPEMQHGVYAEKWTFEDGWQTGMGYVNPMGANLVLETNGSAWWAYRDRTSLDYPNFVQELGYDIADKVQELGPDGKPGPAGIPSISPSGYSRWRGFGVETLEDWGFDVKQTVSWKKGDHYLKFGFSHMRVFDSKNRWVPEGSAQNSFDGFATGQTTRDAEGNINGATFGDPWADLLLGTSSNTRANILGGGGFGFGGIGQLDSSQYSVFVNDDWRVSPDLTLNLGFRWEVPLPPTFDFGRANCYIDVTGGRDNPVQVVPKDLDVLSDFISGGDLSNLAIPFRNLDTNRCQLAHFNYFAPRIGFAWRMFGTNRTVLRMGAGVSYDQDFGILKVNTGYIGPYAGLVSEIQERGHPPRIFLGTYKTLPLAAASQEHRTDYFYNRLFQEGEVYSYNLSLQHELFPGTKAEMAYVGNQGRHIRNTRPWNAALPEGYVAQLLTGESITLRGSQRERRPYPKIRPNAMTNSDGNMYYNSLQMKLERRFQDGLAITTGWTWSKAMALNYNGSWGTWSIRNEYERHTNKSPMNYDRHHTYYGSFVWVLPFFKDAGGLTQSLLGGWEATSIITLATGRPYGIQLGQDLWNQGTRRRIHPNRIGDGNLPDNQRTVDRYFDTSAFVAVRCVEQQIRGCLAEGDLGNSAYRPLRADGLSLVDFSFHKAFSLGEERVFDIRVDMFNAFNHPVLNFPSGSADSSSFGKVTSTGSGRQIQFGFRYSY